MHIPAANLYHAILKWHPSIKCKESQNKNALTSKSQPKWMTDGHFLQNLMNNWNQDIWGLRYFAKVCVTTQRYAFYR